MDQPAVEPTSRRPQAALWALACVALLAGCAGENLFTGVSASGAAGGGPTVDIAAPTENATVTRGAAVRVRASTTSDAGAVSAAVSGHYSGSDTRAYNSTTINLFNAITADFEVTINAADGQTAGQAYIVVQVTDGLGGVGKDSVKVTIN